MFSDYNKKPSKIDWGYNSDDLKMIKCQELELGKTYTVRGMFITPTKMSDMPVLVLEDTGLLMTPNRYIDVIKDIIADEAKIAAIKEKKLGIKVTTFKSKKYNRDGYDVEFVDL